MKQFLSLIIFVMSSSTVWAGVSAECNRLKSIGYGIYEIGTLFQHEIENAQSVVCPDVANTTLRQTYVRELVLGIQNKTADFQGGHPRIKEVLQSNQFSVNGLAYAIGSDGQKRMTLNITPKGALKNEALEATFSLK